MLTPSSGVTLSQPPGIAPRWTPDCPGCGKPMKDHSYWHGMLGRQARYRCIEANCAASINDGPTIIPSYWSERVQAKPKPVSVEVTHCLLTDSEWAAFQ